MLNRTCIPWLILLLLFGCGGGGGSGDGGAVAVMPAVTLEASASEVKDGDAVTLTWSSTDAASCSASGSWSGSLALSGNQSVTVSGNSTFSITCTGSGRSGSNSVSVIGWGQPSVSISSSDPKILTNNPVTITWSSQNASSCSAIAGLPGGTLPTSGSQESGVLTSNTTFSVACNNPFYSDASASTTVTISATYTLTVTALYERPGATIAGSSGYLMPDWGHPVAAPIPNVYVELQLAGGSILGSGYADDTGQLIFAGLDPNTVVTPVLKSKARGSSGLDLWVVNNTLPTSTSASTLRSRYTVYEDRATEYVADKKHVNQSLTFTAPLGWDSTSSKLIDADRISAPYAIIADLIRADDFVSVNGAQKAVNAITVLWSVHNKGGRTDFLKNYDQGTVDGSGGFYWNCSARIDVSGFATCGVGNDVHIFLSGDQLNETMEMSPFLVVHETTHFIQAQSQRSSSPGGAHASTGEYQDITLVQHEGMATGMGVLTSESPKLVRPVYYQGELLDFGNDFSRADTDSPLGWFQERTFVQLIWNLFNPAGQVRMTGAQIVAPFYSSEWKNGIFAPNTWAYGTILKSLNPSSANAIDQVGSSLNITLAGNDVWGTYETILGNRTAEQTFPIFTRVPTSGSVRVCAAGTANEYNKLANRRYLRFDGDGSPKTYTVQGDSGTVPYLYLEAGNRTGYIGGSNSFVWALTVPAGGSWGWIGDCSVVRSMDPTETDVCVLESPPAQQCFTISVAP